MAEIAELGLKITSDDVVKATKRLDRLEAQSKKTEGAAKKNTGAFETFKRALPIIALAATAKAILGVADRFQQLNARLLTATGSQEAANLAFENLRDLAFEMPGSIEEVTSSFIKLNNLGLNPSREALISYGNTAAAMGKSLDQLIEAVADAATGEFERLKEFGIKTRNEGDQIAFTFQGITTRVQNSGQAIEEYLIGLGENQFAGAMEEQNKTLGASFTDLSDSIALATEKLADESGFTAWVSRAASEVAHMFRVMSGTESISDMEARLEGLRETLQELQEEGAGGIFGLGAATGGAANVEAIQQQVVELEANIAEARAKARQQAAATEQAQRDADLSKDIDKIRESTRTELEIATEKYARRKEILEQALESEQLTREEFNELNTRTEKEYSDKRNKIAKAEADAKLAIYNGIFGNLASLMSSGNKKMFEVGKIGAIAQTTINAYQAISKALAEGGPILGPIWATAIGAAAFAQVDGIRNTSFQGGGGGGKSTPSVPSGGGGTSAPAFPIGPPPDQTQQQAGTTVNISLGDEADIVPKSTVRKLIESINDEIRNGAVIEGITVS